MSTLQRPGIAAVRLSKELRALQNPPAGVWCTLADPDGDDLFHLHAGVIGPDDTPYAGGHFDLDIAVPETYPNEPPHVKFVTPIYHMNIDENGIICLSILKKLRTNADEGWKPARNISQVLLSILSLMSAPNPDDPLLPELASLYLRDPQQYEREARRMTMEKADGKTDYRKHQREHQREQQQQHVLLQQRQNHEPQARCDENDSHAGQQQQQQQPKRTFAALRRTKVTVQSANAPASNQAAVVDQPPIVQIPVTQPTEDECDGEPAAKKRLTNKMNKLRRKTVNVDQAATNTDATAKSNEAPVIAVTDHSVVESKNESIISTPVAHSVRTSTALNDSLAETSSEQSTRSENRPPAPEPASTESQVFVDIAPDLAVTVHELLDASVVDNELDTATAVEEPDTAAAVVAPLVAPSLTAITHETDTSVLVSPSLSSASSGAILRLSSPSSEPNHVPASSEQLFLHQDQRQPIQQTPASEPCAPPSDNSQSSIPQNTLIDTIDTTTTTTTTTTSTELEPSPTPVVPLSIALSIESRSHSFAKPSDSNSNNNSSNSSNSGGSQVTPRKPAHKRIVVDPFALTPEQVEAELKELMASPLPGMVANSNKRKLLRRKRD